MNTQAQTLCVAVAVHDEALSRQALNVLQSMTGTDISITKLPVNGTLLGSTARLSQPHVLVVDLAALGKRFGETIRALRAASTQLAIVVLNQIAEADTILEVMRAGAREFLYEAIDVGLRDAVVAIRDEFLRNEPQLPKPARLFAFVSAKGGCGLTTLVTHSAAAFSRESNSKLLMTDLHLASSSVAFMLGVTSPHTLESATAIVHRMDATLWKSLAMPTPYGFSLAPVPATNGASGKMETNGFRDLLRFCKTQYDEVFADCGVGINEITRAVLAEADEVILVSSTEITALHHAKRMLQECSTSAKPVRLVLNRVPKNSELTAAELEKLLNHPIFATIPNDYGAMANAAAEGKLLAPEHPLNQSIATFTRQLTGLAEPEKKRRFRLFR